MPTDYPFTNTDANAFLSTLWPRGVPAGHYLALWTLLDKATYQHPTIESFIQAAARVYYGTDTYYGVGLSRRITGRKSRPGLADISLVPGAWLDLDAKNGVTFGQLEEYLDSFYPPTVSVYSGHGIQAYWCWHSPLPAKVAAPLVEGFTRWHQQRAPFPIDSLHDVSRVLRLPGTYNYKDTEHIVQATMRSAFSARYDPQELPTVEVVRMTREELPNTVPESGGPFGGRDNTLYKWLCANRRFGLTESQLLTIARAFNAEHMSPPLSDELVATKVRSAAKHATAAQKTTATDAQLDELKRLMK